MLLPLPAYTYNKLIVVTYMKESQSIALYFK